MRRRRDEVDPGAAAAAAAAGAIDVDALDDNEDKDDCVEVVEVPVAAAANEGSTTPWPFPPMVDIYVNPETRIAHDFTRPARRPLVIAQHPLLHQLVVGFSVKDPLARAQIMTRGQLMSYVVRLVVLDIFHERIASLRETMAEPLFASAISESEGAAEDDASYESFLVSIDMRRGDGDAAAVDGNGDGSLPPLTRKWQSGVSLAVRQLLALSRFGPEPKELALSMKRILKV